MSLTEVSLAAMASIGFLLLGMGVLSALRNQKGSAFANCAMILAGAALLAVVAGAQTRARADTPTRPSVRYVPGQHPSKPYPTPELFRKERDRTPKTQSV